jgi:hypothetical protein
MFKQMKSKYMLWSQPATESLFLQDSMLLSWTTKQCHRDIVLLNVHPEEVIAASGVGTSSAVLTAAAVQCLAWAMPHSLLEVASKLTILVEEAHRSLVKDLGSSSTGSS